MAEVAQHTIILKEISHQHQNISPEEKEIVQALFQDSNRQDKPCTTAQAIATIIRQGFRSFPAAARLAHRVMEYYNTNRFRDISFMQVMTWLLSLKSTKPQTKAEYLKILQQVARMHALSWAQHPFIPRIIKGLREIAPIAKQARPISVQDFRLLYNQLDSITRLAAVYTFITGSRLAETFGITPEMIAFAPAHIFLKNQSVNAKFYLLRVDTRGLSKTGMTDPAALRFTDVAVMHEQELLFLRKAKPGQPIFSSTVKQRLLQTLAQYQFTGHSFKRGTARLLTELHQEGSIQEAAIPFFLKHMNPLEQIPSVTAAYLDSGARINILSAKGIFKAALLLRHCALGDCIRQTKQLNQ